MHDLFKSIVDDFTSLPAKVAASQAKASEVKAPTVTAVLSARETVVAKAVAQGRSTKVIAAELGLHINTVGSYRARVLKKLGLHSNAELAVWFERQRQPDYRQALADLVALVESIHSASQGRWPAIDINCAVCTQGCAPASGVCAWHAAMRMLAVKS